ncbi:UDP-glycosyltransferase 91C1-like [Morus notabilis]|uniref:UDP-glycosyltransferase 91C1-like n=1 Tax=Morus notabilis TaxID=981085 RepID=UPI000CED17F7|nr:UDP-glycosyltransferase 91C1-like [Morus notabilis]
MEKKDNRLHIAIFPWLAYGHVKPFFELSKFLAQKGHKISFISTPKNLQRLPKHPHIDFVSFPLPHVDGLPQGTESTSELPIHKVPFLKKAYDKLVPSLTQFLKESTDIKWIVHDFLCHWAPRVATEHGVNSVFLYITTATSLAFFGPPSKLLGSRQRPEDATVVPKWFDFESNVAYKLFEIKGHWECMDEDATDVQRLAETIQCCDIVVSRTSPEFESDSLNLLRKLYGKPVLPIGFLPISPQDLHSVSADERWGTLSQWLDSKEENSVLYIAFGTELSLTQDLMHELARGIEKSGLPFIWVMKDRPLIEGQLGSEIIPPGFETRVAGRGLVWRGWVPQLSILAHSSVGGFLTHCGWSSVIEVLGFGKPLVLFAGASSDLGLISRLLHGKRVGLEVPRNEETGSFTSESVSEIIKQVVMGKDGESVRANTRAAKEIFGNVDINNKWLEDFNMCLGT